MKNILPLFTITVIIISTALVTKAQAVFQRNDSIIVSVNGDTLTMPWAGGLNNPEYWAADLNNDGIPDLVIFDRGCVEYTPQLNGDKILTFINHGTPNKVDYVYAPEYEQYFPGVSHYMVMVDMNCDKITDLLTSSSVGDIIMYLGHFDAQNHMYFTGPDTLMYHEVDDTTEYPINFLFTGIPAAVDVNGDGAIDILSFDNFSNAYINLYENLSEQLTGTCGDSITFLLQHNCWGNIGVSPVSNHVSFDVSCFFLPAAPATDGAGPRHMGGTINALDEEGNGLIDLILGDISYNKLTSVVNSGTPDSAIMNPPADSTYPAYDTPVNIIIYPASFYIDVDNDGRKDLLAAPNLPDNPNSYATGVSQNVSCSWFYKNISTTDTVHFHYQTDSFLVNQMIDLGEGAYPAFIDIDGDGLKDLVVGNMGYFVDIPSQHLQGQLAYFRNTGTNTLPAFQLMDRDFAHLSSVTVGNLPIAGVAPAFGDMDGDGDLDMIVGDATGQLQYFENTAGPGNPAVYSLTGPTYFGIGSDGERNNSVPFIYDVNGDGIPDLLIGGSDGRVYYYQNRGTRTNPQFDQIATNAFFGGIDVRTQIPGSTRDITGYSSPIITPLDSSGKLYVLVGAEEGKIYQYEFNRDSIDSGAFVLDTLYFSGIDEGEFTNLAVARLTTSNLYQMVTGNYRGGLTFYNENDSLLNGIKNIAAASNISLEVFPNPASKHVSLVWQLNGQQGTAEIEIIDILGRTVLTRQEDAGSGYRGSATLDVSNFARGLYDCRLIAGDKYVTRKLLIQ